MPLELQSNFYITARVSLAVDNEVSYGCLHEKCNIPNSFSIELPFASAILYVWRPKEVLTD